MQDDQGYFGRFKQCLYFARLQTDQLASLEAGAGSSGQVQRFDRQQQLAFSEAAVEQLYRSLCFLASLLLSSDDALTLRQFPARLGELVDATVAGKGNAAQQLLQQQVHGALSGLIDAHCQLWQLGNAVQSSRSDAAGLIPLQAAGIDSDDCRRWASELSALADQVVDLQTES